MQKLVKRISLVMVALMTVFTALSYVPAKAATVVPKVQFVGEQKTEFTAGERITFNLNASNYGGRVQYRVVLWNDSTKSYSDLWNTADKYYTNWMPYGNETLPLGWVINEPGTYRITVYAKRAGLANSKTALKGMNCDSYLNGPAFTVKPAAATPTVDSIAPVADVTVNEGETPVLPAEVTLNLSDKTTKTAKVTWDKVDTTKVGTAAVAGTVEGTDKKASVNVIVKAVDLAVKSVSAANLKEVNVEFNKAVDKDTATDEANYTITGNKTITVVSASLSDDNKTVTLVLNNATPLDNQKDYKLSFNNVKDANKANVLKVTDYKFMPVDSTLPVPTSAEALGNKTVKVTFAEPVLTTTSISSFMIDGKAIVGNIEAKGGRTVIIKVYSPLANGEHIINVKNVMDYANFISLSKDLTFTVVEDKVAPVVSSIESATFEQVTVKFSEVVDSSTVLASNVYWMQGTSKKYADNVVALSGDTYRFEFNNVGNRIQYATDLYIVGIKDYSGNVIASDTKIQVSPTLDLTRPEVVNAELDSNRQNITVKFSKILESTSANKSANYVIKDADGKEVSKLKTATLQLDNKTVKVALSILLSEGKDYTLEISGVTDNTTLKNTMLPYTKTLSISDTTGPDSSRIIVNKTVNNSIVITYPEIMSVGGDGSIVDPAKYFYSKDSGATWKTISSDVMLNVTPDGKSAILVFPSDINVSTINGFRIQLVKDLAGNYITGLTKDFTLGTATAPAVDSVVITGTNEISVTFNSKILENTINPSDFKVTAGPTSIPLNIISASLASDGKTVVLTLADASELNENGTFGSSKLAVNLEIASTTSTASPEGKPIASYTKAPIAAEEIAATVQNVLGSADGTQISVLFNEDLGAIAAADADATATDFVVSDKNGVLTPKTDYTVAIGAANEVIITFVSGARTGIMKVAIANPRFLKDAKGNVVDAMDATEVDVDKEAPAATLGAAGVGTNEAIKLEITFSEDLYIDGVKVVDGTDLKANFETTGTVSITSADYTAKKVTLVLSGATNADTIKVKAGTFADHDGNVYTQETMTFDGTKWAK